MSTKEAATPESNGLTNLTKITIKDLPTTFTGTGPYKGFEFALICVSKWAFCYELNVGGQIYYHTFKRRENTRFGLVSYPGPKAFGIWAWCYRRKIDAVHRFNQIGHE